jgi:hypothetical protein
MRPKKSQEKLITITELRRRPGTRQAQANSRFARKRTLAQGERVNFLVKIGAQGPFAVNVRGGSLPGLPTGGDSDPFLPGNPTGGETEL